MGGKNSVGEASELRLELLGGSGGLLGEDVHGAASHVLGLDRGREGRDVNDLAAGGVDEVDALLHRSKLGSADHVGGLVSERDVKSNNITVLDHLSKRVNGRGVAQGKLGHVVVVLHVHTQGLREHGNLRANVAIAHNTESLAAHFPAVVGHLHSAHASDEGDDKYAKVA